MFQKRTFASNSRAELAFTLYHFFRLVKAKPLRLLFTGNPNGGKMLGAVTAKAAFDDAQNMEFLLSEEGKRAKLNRGVNKVTIQGSSQNIVFRHDSLARIAPYFEEMVLAAGEEGHVICTAITKASLGKIHHDPDYSEAFKASANIYDIAIDIRSDAWRGVTRMRSLISPVTHIRQPQFSNDAFHEKEASQYRRIEIEIDDQTRAGQLILADRSFQNGFWDRTLSR